MITPTLTGIACLECGHEQAADQIMAAACPVCGSHWLDAHYDYAAIKATWQDGLPRRPHTLWRYAELLPVQPTLPEISMGEGFTPLTRLYAYERLYNRGTIYVKDERAQPTNSFKDRQAAVTVMALRQRGIHEIVLASTGNAAVAYAAYCARTGIKLWLFLTSLVPAEKMREAALYGCEVVKVSGTYDETKHVAAEFARHKGIHFDRGAKAVPGKESMKTIAFEIAEQLGLVAHPDDPARWQAPDWYIQAVSGGIGPLGVWKGFSELHRMGLIDRMPKLGIVQAAGCSPMVEAFHNGHDQAMPVVPKTLITVLATGDPGYSYTLLREAVLSNGGTMLAIEDGETFRAMRQIASRGGLSVEPATAVAFAGLERLLEEGTIGADETVVINCSGHTFPAESHILGDQYERYILDLEVSRHSEVNGHIAPQADGLGAALQNLDEQVTTIVIVDDNPNDRRLIRRLLQSYKQYRVYEARDGEEAIQVIRDRRPDLIVSDLTMPGMDGFSLLARLKSEPEIAHIPVVIVSAKELTAQDRHQLDAYAASVWQKGGFDTHHLIRHVIDELGQEPPQNGNHEPERANHPQAPLVPVAYTHTIVIIDDNANDRRLARRMIQSTEARYDVVEAASGREGLKAIYHHHPDLILLDLNLPDLDGSSILEQLQRDAKLSEMPVIIYSALTLTDEAIKQLPPSIRAVISKTHLDRRHFLEMIQQGLL